MLHHQYGVDEAIVSLVLADDPASESGVVNGPWYPAYGLQSFGYVLNPQTEKLITEGVIRAQEQSIDEVPVTLERGRYQFDVDALILNLLSWFKANGNQMFMVTSELGDVYFSLKVRTKKVGINGVQKIITIPKIKASGLDRSGAQRSFGQNKSPLSAFYTDSTYPGYKLDGTPVQKQAVALEELDLTGAALYSAVTTIPTVTSVGGSTSGTLSVATATFNTNGAVIVFPIAMNPTSINDLTAILLDGSSNPVACSVLMTGTGVDVNKQWTVKPKSAQSAGSFSLKLLSAAVRSFDNVKLANDFTKAITLT